MTTTNATATAPLIAPSAPVEIEIAVDERPAPPAPKLCSYCGLEGQHPEPQGSIACIACGKTHGEAISVRDRPTGQMVERKVFVLHSLGGIEREGGRKNDGSWSNPGAPWAPRPICGRCGADLKCATFDARKKASNAGARWHELPPWPEFWALHLAVEEAGKRNAADAERRAQREVERTRRQAERQAEDERRKRVELLVAKGYRVHRDAPQRNDRGPQRDDHRRNGNEERGKRHGGRDARGNPSFGGRGYVTPDDVANAE